MLVYSSLLLAVLVGGAPWWVARMATSGRYRAGLPGRLGRVPVGLREACAGKQVVWLHAVSVGEVLAATRLVEELQAALPGVVVAVSTTTETGQRLARERFPDAPVFYLPLDFGVLMRRYIGVLRPRLVVLMESELWPNMIRECARAGVPVAVANARVSDRSFPRYMRLKRVWGPLLREISVFLAQSEETAERLRAMGIAAERVVVTGNMKFDVRAREATPIAQRVIHWKHALGAKLMVAGSTLEGEEETLLTRWRTVQKAAPTAMSLLLIAPRHTNRFEEIFTLIERRGYVPLRCSNLPEPSKEIFFSGNVVLLLDTIGDLASVYGAADVAFVGGSLVAKGGHNPLEPAQFGVPVVMGASYENFREIVEAMRAADGLRIVANGDELASMLIELLSDPEQAKSMGARGRRVFEAQQGATVRTVAALTGLVR